MITIGVLILVYWIYAGLWSMSFIIATAEEMDAELYMVIVGGMVAFVFGGLFMPIIKGAKLALKD